MARSQIIPRDFEREFRYDELFFSSTDEKGVIQSCNDVFVRISGYEWSEVIGAPHSMIRHPDMPRCVFKLFWEHLQAKKPIVAYVKNMAADGGYYWVTALALPVKGGYLSVRLKPTSPLLRTVQTLYQQLLQIEATQGAVERKEGMAASYKALFEALKGMGYPTYEAFMKHALREELTSREKLRLANNKGKRLIAPASVAVGMDQNLSVAVKESATVNLAFEKLFAMLDQLLKLNASLDGKTDFISEVSETTQILALNACVESARLGDDGRALSVLADNLSVSSVDIAKMAGQLTRELTQLGNAVQEVSFDLSVAKLQVEMLSAFISPPPGESNAAARQVTADAHKRMVGDVKLLAEMAGESAARATKTLVQVGTLSSTLGTLADRLGKSFQTLRFVHLGGLIESSRISQENGFTVILSEILENIELTRSRLGDLTEAVGAVKNELMGVELVDHAVGASFHRMTGAVGRMAA